MLCRVVVGRWDQHIIIKSLIGGENIVPKRGGIASCSLLVDANEEQRSETQRSETSTDVFKGYFVRAKKRWRLAGVRDEGVRIYTASEFWTILHLMLLTVDIQAKSFIITNATCIHAFVLLFVCATCITPLSGVSDCEPKTGRETCSRFTHC